MRHKFSHLAVKTHVALFERIEARYRVDGRLPLFLPHHRGPRHVENIRDALVDDVADPGDGNGVSEMFIETTSFRVHSCGNEDLLWTTLGLGESSMRTILIGSCELHLVRASLQLASASSRQSLVAIQCMESNVTKRAGSR